jgi:hypothetical protein
MDGSLDKSCKCSKRSFEFSTTEMLLLKADFTPRGPKKLDPKTPHITVEGGKISMLLLFFVGAMVDYDDFVSFHSNELKFHKFSNAF